MTGVYFSGMNTEKRRLFCLAPCQPLLTDAETITGQSGLTRDGRFEQKEFTLLRVRR